jgi:hypothetical protein
MDEKSHRVVAEVRWFDLHSYAQKMYLHSHVTVFLQIFSKTVRTYCHFTCHIHMLELHYRFWVQNTDTQYRVLCCVMTPDSLDKYVQDVEQFLGLCDVCLVIFSSTALFSKSSGYWTVLEVGKWKYRQVHFMWTLRVTFLKHILLLPVMRNLASQYN